MFQFLFKVSTENKLFSKNYIVNKLISLVHLNTNIINDKMKEQI